MNYAHNALSYGYIFNRHLGYDNTTMWHLVTGPGVWTCPDGDAENARPENDGQDGVTSKCRTWNCTWTYRTWNAGTHTSCVAENEGSRIATVVCSD